MKKKIPLILTLIVLVSGAISFCLLTRGHSWLDDFASYLMQAKSIVNGSMAEFVHRNAFTVTTSSYPPGPAAYPWGFPLLLAPVYIIFGMNTLAFKLVNTLFYALFLVTFFGLARTRLKDGEALLLTATLGFSPALLMAHDQIISDIPFLFFCTLGLFLTEFFIAQNSKSSPQSTQRDTKENLKSSFFVLLRALRGEKVFLLGISIGAAIFAASFIRTNGVLLFIPLALGQFLQLRAQRHLSWMPAITPYLTFGILFAAQALIFPNGQDSYLSHFSMFSLSRLWENFVFYLWLPAWLFREIPAGEWLYPVWMIFVVVSIAKHGKRDLPLHAYSLGTVALYILWPERQGLRFIYPILPLMLILAFDGMKLTAASLTAKWQSAAGWALRGLWLVVIVVSLSISAGAAGANLAAERATNGPFDPVSGEMFSFLREKTSPQSIIIFFRPRALRLLTDRDTFMTEHCTDLPKGDYLALSEKVGDNGQIPPEEIGKCKDATLEKVFNNKRFTVYKIGK